MAKKRFTDEERAEIFSSFVNADPEQLSNAQTVAAILAEDEEDVSDAALAFTYYYSQSENKKLLEEMMARLSITDI